ncbi:MAG: RDD family protein [bacterium]
MPASKPDHSAIPNRTLETGYPAGIGRRFGALLYDTLLIVAIWMATLLVWVIASGGEAVTGWLIQLVLLAQWLGFYLYFWSRQGQTLGMTAWRIKVVNQAGKPASFLQLLKRAVVAPVSFLCLGLGFLWFYMGDRQQTWHDRASQTMVVYIPKA